MTGNEYTSIMNRIASEFAIAIQRIRLNPISNKDLNAALCIINTAENVGHILDPTQYIKAVQTGTLDHQRKLVLLYKHLKKELTEITDQLVAREEQIVGRLNKHA